MILIHGVKYVIKQSVKCLIVNAFSKIWILVKSTYHLKLLFINYSS